MKEDCSSKMFFLFTNKLHRVNKISVSFPSWVHVKMTGFLGDESKDCIAISIKFDNVSNAMTA